MVHSMKTSMSIATALFWSVRIISRPVRSPTCARRAYLWPPKSRCRMRPSFVRSKRAPHSSSSSTRSGDSCACSWAMRQLLSSLPPRMVSRKWTCQLSSFHTFASAAAMPPSAMTVCALPRSDLQTIAVFAPRAVASIAARSPAPPAPMTTTSKSCVVVISGDPPWIVEDAHREKADVEVGEGDDDEARPGPARVPRVQPVGERPEPEAQRLSVEAVEIAAEEIAHRVAGERVAGEEQDVREHDERPETDAEPSAEVEREDRVPPQEREDDRGEVQEVAVEVLDDEGEARLAGVAAAHVGDGARRGRPEERAVVAAAVVITGDAERDRERHDEDRRGEVPPRADDRQDRVRAVRGNARRVERREIRLGEVVRVRGAGEGRIDDEERGGEEDDGRLEPPQVIPPLGAPPPGEGCPRLGPRYHPPGWVGLCTQKTKT